MSRIALIASLAGAVALGSSAFSAQAATGPMGSTAVHTNKMSLVEKVQYRHHHSYHRHHTYHRHHRYHHGR